MTYQESPKFEPLNPLVRNRTRFLETIAIFIKWQCSGFLNCIHDYFVPCWVTTGAGQFLADNFIRATASNLHFRLGIPFDGLQLRISEDYVGHNTRTQSTKVCTAIYVNGKTGSRYLIGKHERAAVLHSRFF